MNWMGGNLSRHSRGKGWKEDVARQKEYFAKARTRQRERINDNLVTLSAADFIPDYRPSMEVTADPAESASSLSMLLSQPLRGADEALANLASEQKVSHRHITQRPLVVPRVEKDPSLILKDQSSEDHFSGAPDLEAGQRRNLRKTDCAGIELPKPSASESTRRRELSTTFRHISEPQQHIGPFTSHRKRPSSAVGQQGDNRKRKSQKVTSSPSPILVRIRVGSQDYRWSEAGNSIRNPTHYGDCSSRQSAEETGRKVQTRNVNSASYITNESFTSFSSSSSSSLPWSSPCKDRVARSRRFPGSAQHIVMAAPAESHRPILTRACASLLKSPPLASEVDSIDSMAVGVSDAGEGEVEVNPEIEVDEERIWRQWLG
ncbi:hypothetical protein TARUN_5727 [Trichoderma arundinaceum]|uniref:Uncharacterized protein n=1 Tax=Trichoderma arundinaceum TaxID=490622 RepID=A0A395NKW3_TRIAR|nr:hypothetical protein TARUN_5727 [Trichoderma arundinaceum]